jgi:[ribosomal protein S5]-alanine N-acetyltransferase
MNLRKQVEKIRSERLLLRPLRRKDAAFIFEIMNSREWKEFIGERGIKNLEDALQTINWGPLRSYRTHGFGLMGMQLRDGDQDLVGLCGLLQRNYLDAPDLGFALLAQYAGKGYAREACEALIEHYRQAGQIKRIMAFTDRENFRSQRLLLKLGFQNKGSIHPPGENVALSLFELALG